MQFLGSLLSGLEAAADAINRNEDGERARAFELFLRTAAPSQVAVPPGSREEAEASFGEFYAKAYQDFEAIRADLRRLPDAIGEIAQDEVEGAYAEVFKRLARRVSRRPAENCLKIAALVVQDAFPANPVDRYFLDAAAPTITQLEGSLARHHEVLMECILAWLKGSHADLWA